MKNICLLIKSNMRRNPMSILFSVFGGLILCLLLYFMGNYVKDLSISKIKIGLIDYDHSPLSINFKSYLSNDLDYHLIEDKDYDSLSEMLIDKEISAIIEIPSNFHDDFASARDTNIIITSTDDFENIAFLEAYMNSYLAGIRILSMGAKGDKEAFNRYLDEYEQTNIPISKARAFNLDLKEFKEKEGFRNSIGFYLMIVFVLGTIIAFIIVDDKSTGIYKRITITPVKPLHYIAGNSIFGFVLLMIEVVIYCVYIRVMDFNIGFPLYKLFFIMLLLSCFITCFIIDASIVLKSRSSVTSLIMGFSTVGAILGGAYFPIDMAPESLQNLARIFPQFWFMDALRKLVDNPMANVTSNIIILLLYTILAFLIGAVLFSQNYKKG